MAGQNSPTKKRRFPFKTHYRSLTIDIHVHNKKMFPCLTTFHIIGINTTSPCDVNLTPQKDLHPNHMAMGAAG